MKLSTSAKEAIEFLVASYREALEDDGDLVASEIEKSVNNVAKASYSHDEDSILVEGDKAEIQACLPADYQNLFSS